MTNLYLPGAKVIPGRDGGTMLGGPAKVVWHTTENDPAKTSASAIAHYLVSSGNTVHLVWNPLTGEIVQMIPANLAGRGLENRAGGVETNRAGSVVIQIEVVGRAAVPFTNRPMVNLPKIQAWLASLGIPPVWSGTTNRSTANWAKAGHFGHMDVPENSHTDPGKVDKTKLATPPIQQLTSEDTMVILRSAGQHYLSDGMTKRVITTPDAEAAYLRAGVKVLVLPDAEVANIPTTS